MFHINFSGIILESFKEMKSPTFDNGFEVRRGVFEVCLDEVSKAYEVLILKLNQYLKIFYS